MQQGRRRQPGASELVEQPRLVEKWTLRITKVDVPAQNFWFDLAGSVTGPDGSGQRAKRFVSNSGRVVIEPSDWWLKVTKFRSEEPLPVGFEVTWDVIPLFADVYRAPKTNDPARDYATMLVQGLSNARHILQVLPAGDGPVPIRAIRVYLPPLR